jgi:hypothetical protein
MRELLTLQDLVLLGHYKSILEAEGITSFIRNEHLQERSPSDDQVLFIDDDDQFEKALVLLRQHFRPSPVDKADWICHQCNEAVPGSFETCWKCGALAQQP